MVSLPCQDRIKSSHCGRAKDAKNRARASRFAGAVVHLRRADECIAGAPDLWFEGLGFPRPADARQGPDPWQAPAGNWQRRLLPYWCRHVLGGTCLAYVFAVAERAA